MPLKPDPRTSKLDSWVSVDPGDKTGVAKWRRGELDVPLTFTGDLESRVGHFLHLVVKMRPALVVFEEPEFFPSKYHVAASGSLTTLAIGVGVYVGLCIEHGLNYRLVPVRDWKGNMPKSVTLKRVRKHIGVARANDLSEHAVDAVGLGLWELGKI